MTGGCGFIGSHLVDHLAAGGWEVTILDSLISGKVENIARHQKNPHVKFIETDVADFDAILPHFERAEWVFHLAARGEIVPSINEPLAYHKDNVQGTINVCEASRRHQVRRLVYAASSSCYGIPERYPTTEADLIQPRYPYALMKYLAEEIVLHWVKVYKLPAISLRLGNVYGPRSRTSGAYGAVIGTFLAQKLNGKPFTLVGDGTQKRDFLYVTDCVDAFVRAAAADRAGEIYNVGSDAPQTINYLIELLGGGEIVHLPKRPGEPDLVYLDTAKIKRHLNWKPLVSFEKGIEQVLAHKGHWRQAPVWTRESIAEATQDWFKYLGG